jgi:hypothetical protein
LLPQAKVIDLLNPFYLFSVVRISFCLVIFYLAILFLVEFFFFLVLFFPELLSQVGFFLLEKFFFYLVIFVFLFLVMLMISFLLDSQISNLNSSLNKNCWMKKNYFVRKMTNFERKT